MTQPPEPEDLEEFDYPTRNKETTNINNHSPDNQLSHPELLERQRGGKKNNDCFEEDSNRFDQRQNKVPEVHIAHVRVKQTPSRAARLNRVMLFASIFCLFGCTIVVFLLIVC